MIRFLAVSSILVLSVARSRPYAGTDWEPSR